MCTFDTATKYVVNALEATGSAGSDDFDVPAIVHALHALIEGWDFELVDRATFWSVIAGRMRW